MTPGAPISEVADMIGVSERTLQRMWDAGELAGKAVRGGG
jgi:predicted DNA-binding transcriptional regulator YafY